MSKQKVIRNVGKLLRKFCHRFKNPKTNQSNIQLNHIRNVHLKNLVVKKDSVKSDEHVNNFEVIMEQSSASQPKKKEVAYEDRESDEEIEMKEKLDEWWLRSEKGVKLPLPLDYPDYLRDEPELQFKENRAYKLRLQAFKKRQEEMEYRKKFDEDVEMKSNSVEQENEKNSETNNDNVEPSSRTNDNAEKNEPSSRTTDNVEKNEPSSRTNDNVEKIGSCGTNDVKNGKRWKMGPNEMPIVTKEEFYRINEIPNA